MGVVGVRATAPSIPAAHGRQRTHLCFHAITVALSCPSASPPHPTPPRRLSRALLGRSLSPSTRDTDLSGSMHAHAAYCRRSFMLRACAAGGGPPQQPPLPHFPARTSLRCVSTALSAPLASYTHVHPSWTHHQSNARARRDRSRGAVTGYRSRSHQMHVNRRPSL